MLDVPVDNMNPVHNLQFLGKYLYRTRVTLCVIIRQTRHFSDNQLEKNNLHLTFG